MTSERRFTEQEVAYILERAAAAEQEDPAGELPSGEDPGLRPTGMTLKQLTDVAREAGLSPDAVVRAAASVERGDLVPTSRVTSFGMPVGVGRIVEFSRRVTDAEWERMVVAFRETFAARGTVRHEGSLRSWNNGNLSAMLEPTASGHRLRLTTRKGDAASLISLGITMLSIAAVLTAIVLVRDVPPMPWWSPGVFVGIGLASIGQVALRLPGWARTRAAQMERLAGTVAGILDEPHPRDPNASLESSDAIAHPTSYTGG